MNRVEIFAILFLVSISFAALCGGRAERRAAAMLLAAGVLSIFAANPRAIRFLGVEWRVMAIDLALLAGLVVLSATMPRRWPVWGAGFQLLTVVGHLARLAYPSALPNAYQALTALPAWFIQLLLIAATAQRLMSGPTGPADVSFAGFLKRWMSRRLASRPRR